MNEITISGNAVLGEGVKGDSIKIDLINNGKYISSTTVKSGDNYLFYLKIDFKEENNVKLVVGGEEFEINIENGQYTYNQYIEIAAEPEGLLEILGVSNDKEIVDNIGEDFYSQAFIDKTEKIKEMNLNGGNYSKEEILSELEQIDAMVKEAKDYGTSQLNYVIEQNTINNKAKEFEAQDNSSSLFWIYVIVGFILAIIAILFIYLKFKKDNKSLY